jgi:lipopolysaccharide transport system permease protein
MNEKIYTPESSLKNPLKLLKDIRYDLKIGKELAWRLAVRDISALYRQSILGIIWAFILPIAHTITWIFLNSSGIVAVGETDIPYPIYVFTGTMIWAIFMESVQMPLQKTTQSKNMLAKISVPSESIILSGVYQSLFNGIIKVILVIGALLILGIYPSWYIILFPIAFFSLILVGTTLGLLLTPIGMLYTDISKALPLVMQFLMYLTPVVYPMPSDGIAGTIVKYNFMTPIIITARDFLTASTPNLLIYFLWVNLIFIALFVIVSIIYRAAMPILIERMSA